MPEAIIIIVDKKNIFIKVTHNGWYWWSDVSGATKCCRAEKEDITGPGSSSSPRCPRPPSTGPGWRLRTRPAGRLTSLTGTLPPSEPDLSQTPSLVRPLLSSPPPSSHSSSPSASWSSSVGGYKGQVTANLQLDGWYTWLNRVKGTHAFYLFAVFQSN